MPYRQICLLFLLLLVPLQAGAQTTPPPSPTTPTTTPFTPQVDIRVHPGVELMVIIQWLGGKLKMPTDSAYKTDAWRTFEKYRNHPAVQKIASYKVVYPDLTELGWAFDGFPNPRITMPRLRNWEKYYTAAEVQDYLEKCLDFYRVSGFWKFYQRHEKDYAAWSAQIQKQLQEKETIQKLESFFRYRTAAVAPHYVICMDPLNGWGAHAIMLKEMLPGYSNYVVYQLGFWEGDGNFPDTPVSFDANTVTSLFWHEGSHVYIQPLFQKNAAAIAQLSRLYNADDPALKQQNISSWEYCLNENMVRAITAALIHQTSGADAYEKECQRQIKGGFIYVKEIADLLQNEYMNQRDQYEDFTAFFPRILAKLDQLHPAPAP